MHLPLQLFLLLLSFFLIHSTTARNTFRFSHLGIENGLAQSCVTSFYQDEFNMIWIATQDGLNRYNGQEFEVFRPIPGDSTSLYSNNIRTVCGNRAGKLFVLCKYALCEMDLRTEKFRTLRKHDVQAISYNRGQLWVCTSNMVWKYDGHTLEEYYRINPHSKIRCIYENSAGYLMIGTANNGILFIDRNRKETSLLEGKHIVNIYEDSKRNLWICTQSDGIYRIDKSGETINYRHNPNDPNSLSDNYTRTVCEDNSGNYWIGTFKGINILYPENRSMLHADHSNDDPHSLPHSSIWSIMKDHQGTIWIGSYFGGISLYNPDYDFYRFHKTIFSNPSLSIISCLTDDGNGNFWIGSESAGLLRYNKNDGSVKKYPDKMFSSHSIKSLWLDKKENTLWIGTLLGGLNRMNLATHRISVYRHKKNTPWTIPDDNIRKIAPAGEHELLLTTQKGVVVFNKRTGTCRRLVDTPEANNRYITDMLIDRDSNCWQALSGKVIRYNLKTHKQEIYFSGEDTPLGQSHVLVLFQDRHGRIWLGSSGAGLLVYRPQTNTFESYTTRNSTLINDYILDIDESPAGYLLLATNGGFTRFVPENGVFSNYTKDNGFPVSDISPYGLYVSSNKEIYVCGFKSLISFEEKELAELQTLSDIYFTALKVNNKKIVTNGPDGILSQSLFYQQGIDLRPGQTTFSIEYAITNYIPYIRNETEYRLTGFDTEWIRGTPGQPIVYTNLAPGTYSLTVRSIDPDKGSILSSRSLTVKVHPPFHKTTWAYLLLTLFLLSIIVLLLRFYTGKLKLRTSLEMEKRERNQIQELNQSKLRFFTYVSHELRTPVTLIQSHLETVLQKSNIPPSIYNRLTGIQYNIGKINRLINELLDFKKQEQDFIPMSFTCQNIVELLGRIHASFREYAIAQQIDFIWEAPDEPIEIWYDTEQLEKVFYNLLSNAFKYTPPQGKICLAIHAEKTHIVIRVSDTGSGIPPMYQQTIFDPFFQVPNDNKASIGTGLGLTVAKGIVKAHYGDISIQSEPGHGTTFSVSLPVGEEHIPPELKKSVPAGNIPYPDTPDNLPDKKFMEEIASSRKALGGKRTRILIVEDNDDLRQHLTSLFEPIYEVIQAQDGMEGWQLLREELPDIILSDLMMPNIDGYELCTKVKNNLTTCHIPFVILTARITEESTLEGFRHGADDYIAKPFNSRILITKCNNLVNSRILMQNKFAQSTSLRPQLIATNSLDQQLIEKAAEVVRKNLTNPDFDIILFAREMALGRTKLFTKLKGVTGQTPNQFITNIRLKTSITLLETEPGLSVGEISYMVGFNSPSYFIKSFHALYGTTPTAYRNNLKNKQKPN